MSVATATSFRTAELVPLFRRMFDLCKLKPTESLVILTEPDTNQEYAAAMYGAARGIGSDTMMLMMPSPPPEQVPVMRSGNVSSAILSGSKLAVETLKKADMVIDLSSGGYCAALKGAARNSRRWHADSDGSRSGGGVTGDRFRLPKTKRVSSVEWRV